MLTASQLPYPLNKLVSRNGFTLSNGYSPANLANPSTHQDGLFEKLVGLAKFAYIRQPGLLGLARLADICQPSFLGLARLAKAKFCK